jgi:Family of unknown function (DUF5677)
MRRRWIQQADGTLVEVQPDLLPQRRTQADVPRLRSIAEIKKRVTGDIAKLNSRLLRVSRRLERVAKKHRAIRSAPGRIVISLFRKAVNTFEAIELLKRRRLIEESWVLLRVLLEAHVNLVYFWLHDPKDMVHRYLDASMLDKLKHLREVNFYEGTALAETIKRQHWENVEGVIKDRYTDSDFKALRKHGFTGLSFEQRAKATHMEKMYKFCYRIASRSVHTFDPAETPVFAVAYKGRRHAKYDLLRSRREQLEANQNMLLGRLAYYLSQFVREAPISTELMLIGVGYEKFRDAAKTLERGPLKPDGGGSEEEPDSNGFYIWRI